MKTHKPPFGAIGYDPGTIAWGLGNAAMVFAPVSTLVLDQEKHDEKVAAQMKKAQEIYERIDRGLKFTSAGVPGGTGMVCSIKRISWTRRRLYWQQTDESLASMNKGRGFYSQVHAGSGAFDIKAFIALAMCKSLILLDE